MPRGILWDAGPRDAFAASEPVWVAQPGEASLRDGRLSVCCPTSSRPLWTKQTLKVFSADLEPLAVWAWRELMKSDAASAFADAVELQWGDLEVPAPRAAEMVPWDAMERHRPTMAAVVAAEPEHAVVPGLAGPIRREVEPADWAVVAGVAVEWASAPAPQLHGAVGRQEGTGRALPVVVVGELVDRMVSPPDNREPAAAAVASDIPASDRFARPPGSSAVARRHTAAALGEREMPEEDNLVESAAAVGRRPDSQVDPASVGLLHPVDSVAVRLALAEYRWESPDWPVVPDNRRVGFRRPEVADTEVQQVAAEQPAVEALLVVAVVGNPEESPVAEAVGQEIEEVPASAADTGVATDNRESEAVEVVAAAGIAPVPGAVAAEMVRRPGQPVGRGRPLASRTGDSYRVASVAGHGIRIVCSGRSS